MIIHSIIPSEIIFSDPNAFHPEYEEIEYMGKRLQVERNKDGSYTVIRIISTDLPDYLNSTIQPGMVVKA